MSTATTHATGGEMTTQSNLEENKRIVRAFIETAFNQHQADRAADYMTSDIKWHGGTLGTVEGRDQRRGDPARC
jgi:limonene-1,2-epoxide hydrolase